MKEPLVQQLSSSLFWDVDAATIDSQTHKKWIIPRVMDRGNIKDAEATRAFYGDKEIQKILLNARGLNKKTISYFALVFHLPRTAFRAYRERSSTWIR